jgi:4'-phosphopantetheinyl transferase
VIADPATDNVPPSAAATMYENEIHVIVTDIDAPLLGERAPYDALSRDERERADRYRFAEHRDRYVARRGLLRKLVGAYLGIPPADVVLTQNGYGKPELASTAVRPALAFNLTHSGGVAVYAFAWDRDLGVDVERVRHDIDHRALARRFFTPGEQVQLLQADETALAEWFFACWTRKEAVVKAHGAGLSLPLESFEVSAGPDDVAPRLDWRPGSGAPGPWRLETFRPRPGHIGSLAVRGSAASVVFCSPNDVLGVV